MEKSFNYNGSNIVYTVDGEGEKVVLLHGFGEKKEIFKQQVSFLKDSCCLIVPDLPGSGSSSILKGENLSIDDYADCIFSILSNENIQECVMLGHSMGGYITLAFTERYPGLLKAFGLIHSTAFEDNAEKKEMRRKGMEMIKEYGAQAFLKNTIPNLFSSQFKQEHPEAVSALIEDGLDFTTEALVQYYNAMMNRPDRTTVLKNANVPVLFILGTEDAAAPLNDLLQQVHLPSISQVNVLNRVGHMGMIEDPEKFNQHISEFILMVKLS